MSFKSDTEAEQAEAAAAGWDLDVVGGGQSPSEWEKAKAFAAERHAALDALGDLGLTDESYWSGGEAATS